MHHQGAPGFVEPVLVGSGLELMDSIDVLPAAFFRSK
jgi:hypothetical protein